MRGWFNKHFSRKQLNTGLLLAAILGFVALVWSNVSNDKVATWLDEQFMALWIWTDTIFGVAAAWLAEDVPLARWEIGVLLTVLAITLLLVLLLKVRALLQSPEFRTEFGKELDRYLRIPSLPFFRHQFTWSRLLESQVISNSMPEREPESEPRLLKLADLSHEQQLVIVLMADPTYRRSKVQDVARLTTLHEYVADQALRGLMQKGLVRNTLNMMSGAHYHITDLGQDFVIDNGLI